MNFYSIDNALTDAIAAADKPVRIKIEIDVGCEAVAGSRFEGIFEQNIIEANFWGLKEVAGGTTARGEILLDNPNEIYSYKNVKPGSQVKVSFSLGDGLPYFHRFNLFLDDKGIQDIRGNGRKRYVRLNLLDLSARLKKTDEARDWTSPALFTYSVICDKTQPEKSLLHGIASRAGISPNDIDCSTIAVTHPFIRLRRNVWAELSSMATAFRCHLECPVEKPLVFAHSPYQTENQTGDEVSHTFTGEDIFYLRVFDRAELYRNTVRLKVNMPVSLEKQEIWRYDEAPVFFDDNFKAFYPFKHPLVREIEKGNYEANYRVIDADGRERNVVFADQIDSQEEAESRIEFNGDGIFYSHYDVTTHSDKATLTLQRDADGDLYKAAIYGRPIVLDLNRSSFARDNEAVQMYGTVALNVTGSYFSEHEVNRGNGTLPHYEDWVIRELTLRLQNRREITVKTHRALFNARVGARVKVKTKNNELTGMINAFSFRYKRDRAFISTFRIIEHKGE